MPRSKMNLYPAFLNLSGKACLVVGGGPVAERKVCKLLVAGACITVVSPRVTAKLRHLAEKQTIQYIERTFERSDVDDKFLIIAATDDPTVNRHVSTLCSAYGKLVNCVDQPELGSFVVPAVVHSCDATIAISTSGVNPSRSKRLKLALERDIQTGSAQFLKEMLSSSNSGKEPV